MVLVQAKKSDQSTTTTTAPDASGPNLGALSLPPGDLMDRRRALAALAGTALVATSTQAAGAEQQAGPGEKGLGAPAKVADLTIGGLAVQLDRGVAAKDIKPHLFEQGGEARLRAYHPRTQQLGEFPFTDTTSHIVAYRVGSDIRLAIVDKPKPDGSSTVGEAVIKPDGTCHVQPNELKGNFKVEYGRGMNADRLAFIGIDVRPEVGRVISARTSLGMDEKTDRVRFEDRNGSVAITVFDRAEADDRVPTPTVFVLDGGQLRKLEEMRPEAPGQGAGPGKEAVLTDFSPANVTKVFKEGFEAANRYARTKGLELSYRGSGVFAKGLGEPAQVNPIEIQEVRAYSQATRQTAVIGGILPEKEHLVLLHSSAEIRDKVMAMVDKHLEGSSPKK